MRFNINAAGRGINPSKKRRSSLVTQINPTTSASAPRRQKSLWRRPQLFAMLHDTVEFVIDSLASERGAHAFEKWQTLVAALYGEVFVRPQMQDHGADYAKRLCVTASPSELVFALHTTYGLLARALVVQHFYPKYKKNFPSDLEFVLALADPKFYQREFGVRNFLPALWDEGILATYSETKLTKFLDFSSEISGALAASNWQNILTDLYQAIIPGNIRHDLGEFFTPDWLAEKTTAMAGFNGETDKKIFDPGCGSGIFLLAAATSKIENQSLLFDLLDSVIGCDLNPLSVLSARLNFLLLLSKHFDFPLPEVELPVFHYDSVFQTPHGNTDATALQKILAGGCDYLIGNPPWISWNCLPPVYRQRLEKELLPQYVLFDFHGQSARLGHSNDDYLSTFTLIAIDRYLKQNGICSFIIKQPLLTNVAGKTFRRFEIRRANDEVTSLRVRRAADLRALDPFGIGNETAILVLEKGAPTVYPIAYDIWAKPNGHLEIKAERAQPSESTDASSAWIVISREWRATQFMEGENPYEIRHGLKHDAAEILILRVLEKNKNRLHIQRLAEETIYEIEPEWIYPFLQPRHLKKWGRAGHFYFLMPQRKAGENNEKELIEQFPLTHAFLKHFAPQFAARRSKVFLHKPFYGLFGLGDYTHAPYKVCWVGLGFQPRFAVVAEVNDSLLGQKTIIPDGTIYFMPFQDQVEAHFVCALLNSELVFKFLSARSGKSKRGLSKKIMEQLALPKFDRRDARHVQLADISLQLHRLFQQRNEKLDVHKNFAELVDAVFRCQAVVG